MIYTIVRNDDLETIDITTDNGGGYRNVKFADIGARVADLRAAGHRVEMTRGQRRRLEFTGADLSGIDPVS